MPVAIVSYFEKMTMYPVSEHLPLVIAVVFMRMVVHPAGPEIN